MVHLTKQILLFLVVMSFGFGFCHFADPSSRIGPRRHRGATIFTTNETQPRGPESTTVVGRPLPQPNPLKPNGKRINKRKLN